MSETRPPSEEPDNSPPGAPEDAEQRVEEIADRFLDQLQAGQAPDRRAVAAAHPELAGLLEKRLAFVESLHRAAREHKAHDSRDTTPDAPALSGPEAETLSHPHAPADTSGGAWVGTSSRRGSAGIWCASFWGRGRLGRSIGLTTRSSTARWR
jgi:hypothetical protein